MSNTAYITTKKHLKSYHIRDLLEKINEKRFDGKMQIEQDQYYWKVSYSGMWDGLDFHGISAKKLACQHPHDPWMSYVFVVFQEELAKLTNGVLSDEGVSETWKPKPSKYSSYEKWIGILYANTKKTKPEAFKEILKAELNCAPEGMEKY